MNIKLTVEYDGTKYHGWQIQPAGETIQSALERAIGIFLGEPIRVTGSGRTDAGVHALGQVANFKTEQVHDRHRILRGLNALTPPDITIKDVEMVPEAFDARRDGRARVYEYRILNRSTPSPFHLNRAWHIHEKLDLSAMRRAMSSLEGEHDFSSFRAAGCEAAHPVRKIYRVSLERRDEILVFTVEATAFLRHMVRNIVGTLIEVGRGLRSPQSFVELLKCRDRTKAAATAPACGLFLVQVKYD